MAVVLIAPLIVFFMLSKYFFHLSILHKNTYVYVIRKNSIMSGTNKTMLEHNWVTILNTMLDNCGGKYKKREISSIFCFVHSRYLNTNDKTLKDGLKAVLLKASRKAPFLQKLGILSYLFVPEKYLYGRKISGVIFSLIGVDRKSMKIK